MEKHESLEKVGAEYSIPLLDLHEFMAEPAIYDSGLIWWDQVHFTQYGHDLAAKFLHAGISERVREGSAQ